ncbi:Sigma-70, region 4 [Rhizobium tibeticum]|uniref:Sigma-70, region 4 n=1 Tax=Rhizobium tibeticum TaxID=501024 RepID=A0ABY1AX13_9HYPH|nr:Sigma-70, region 4 [Rhizobium tibeticum]
MPRRKQAKRITMKDIRSILRLTCEQGLSVREVSERLRIGKTAVSTYLHRARQAGICTWPIPAIYDDDSKLEKLLFKQAGRPPEDTQGPDFAYVARELKRKGVTLMSFCI